MVSNSKSSSRRPSRCTHRGSAENAMRRSQRLSVAGRDRTLPGMEVEDEFLLPRVQPV